jgi:hypothetical protein
MLPYSMWLGSIKLKQEYGSGRDEDAPVVVGNGDGPVIVDGKYDPVASPLPHRTAADMKAVPDGKNCKSHRQCEEALEKALRKD